MKKLKAICYVLTLSLILFSLTACGATGDSSSAGSQSASAEAPASAESAGVTPAAAASASAAVSQFKPIDKVYKIAWIGWGDADYMGGSITSYCKQLDEQLPEVEFVYSDVFLKGGDAVISTAESLCQSGVSAIIALMPSAALMDVCEKYKVYLGGAEMAITDKSLIAYLEKSKYWIGMNPHGGDEQEGYNCAKTLYDNGAKNFVLISANPGMPSPDLRFAGMQKFINENKDAKCLGVYQGDDKPKGLSNLISLYGEQIDAALMTGVSQGGLEGCVNAVQSANLDIKLGCIDMSESSSECFDNGILQFEAGGNNIDPGSMVVPAMNALTDNYKGPVYMYPPFIECKNSEDYKNYMKFIEGDVPAFTADELRQFMRVYNPNATDEDYVKYIETEFNLKSIMGRHVNLVK